MIVNIKDNVVKKSKKYKSNMKTIKDETVAFFKEKGKMKKIKNLLKRSWQFIIRSDVLNVLLLACPFIIMDLFTRIHGNAVSFYSLFKVTPRLFSVAYIILFIGIALNVKKKYSKFTYSLFFFIFFILFIAQNIYYSTMSNFFGFSILALAGEGSDYFLDALKNCNIFVYIFIIILIVNYVIIMKRYPKNVKYNKSKIIKIAIIFILLHIFSKSFLGFGKDLGYYSSYLGFD